MKHKNNAEISEKEVQRKSGKEGKSRGRRLSVGYLIVAFVAALMLWFYVADYDTIVEKTFTNIPVELIYPTKADIVVESGEGKLVNVTVYGKKADINEINAGDIRAYVDVSSASKDGEINAEIMVDLPNDVNLVENNALSVTHIMVTLATPTSKQLDLEVKVAAGTWDDIYTLMPECEPKTIEIIGSSSIVERVKSARVSIDVGEIERPKQVRGKIELIDDSGETVPQTYLQILEPNGPEIQGGVVEVYVRMEMEKEVPLSLEFTGGVFSPEDANIRILPETVKVRGSVDKLRRMESITVSIDETEIDGNSYTGTLPLPDLEDGLYYEDEEKEVNVSVQFRDIQSVTVTLTAEDIRAIGLPEGLDAVLQFLPDENGIIPESVDITVRGYRESIMELRREQLGLLDISVDFTEFAASDTGIEVGQKYASLNVNIGFINLQGVFTTDTVKVSAEIVEEAEPEPEA